MQQVRKHVKVKDLCSHLQVSHFVLKRLKGLRVSAKRERKKIAEDHKHLFSCDNTTQSLKRTNRP